MAYLIPGCAGTGVRLGSESSSSGAAAVVWKSGNQEIQESGSLESDQNRHMKILKMKICHAQNVGKVLVSNKKGLQAIPMKLWCATLTTLTAVRASSKALQ